MLAQSMLKHMRIASDKTVEQKLPTPTQFLSGSKRDFDKSEIIAKIKAGIRLHK